LNVFQRSLITMHLGFQWPWQAGARYWDKSGWGEAVRPHQVNAHAGRTLKGVPIQSERHPLNELVII
jgi:hypothetical protein